MVPAFDARGAANAAGAIGNLVRHDDSLLEQMLREHAAERVVRVCEHALEEAAADRATSIPAYAANALFSLGTLLVHRRVREQLEASLGGAKSRIQGWQGSPGSSTAWDRYVERAVGRF